MHRYRFRRGRITFIGRVEGFEGLAVRFRGGVRFWAGRLGVASLGRTLTSSLPLREMEETLK